MALTTVFGSIGFAARFIIAFVVLAYVSAQNRNDPAIRRGFVLLCVLGAVIFAVSVLIFIGVFVFSGASFMGNALTNFHYNFF